MRDKRAQGMAAMGCVTREGERFRVQSPALRGRRVSYEVWRDEGGKVRCTCLEFEEQSAEDPKFRCEHILAVKHAVLAKNTEAVRKAEGAPAPAAAEGASAPAEEAEPPVAEQPAADVPLPWEVAPLDQWAIVGMNHYFVNKVKHLYVAMVNGRRCIKAEGTDSLKVFDELRRQAEELELETKEGEANGS